MAVYGVSKQTLSQFRYHWFWGIRVAPAFGEDLGEVALGLKRDEIRRKALEDSVERVARFPVVVRWLYWIFNIGNYRVNQYRLSSYWLLRLYEEKMMRAGITQLYEASSIGFSRVAGCILSIPGSLTRSFEKLSQAIRSGWSSQSRIVSSESQTGAQEVLSQAALEIGEAKILVDVGMLNDLACLGIEVSVGSWLTQKSLKEAYRKRCLEVHPDRPGGSHELSVAVNSAYERILTRQPDSSSFVALWRDFQDVQDGIIRLRAEQQVTRELLAEEARIVAGQNGHLAEQDRRLAEQDVALQELWELDRENCRTMSAIHRALYIICCHRLRVFPIPVRVSAEELTRILAVATGRTYRFFPALLPPEGVSGACVENALAVVARQAC